MSVVTPVHNTRDHLPEAIESVLAQTYRNFEYLIVDNASTDGSLEIAQAYARKDDRVRVVSADRFRPQIANYDYALGQISRESRYCKMVQADDWLYPECIEEMVAVAEQDPEVAVVGAYQLAGRHVKCQGLPGGDRSTLQSIVPGAQACLLFLRERRYLFGTPTSVLFRSDAVRSRTPFFGSTSDHPDPYHSDSEVCFQLLRHARFGFVHRILSFTRVDNESRSTSVKDFAPDLVHAYIITRKYGPLYLDEDEYRVRLARVERDVYGFLAYNLPRRRDPHFWSYYKEGFRQAGERLSRARIARLQLRRVVFWIGNPLNTALSAAAALGRLLRSRPMATWLAIVAALVVAACSPAPDGLLPAERPGEAAGPLRVHSDNSRYFSDPDGNAVLLVGSHTWFNLQDAGPDSPPAAFDYTAYLDSLTVWNHNFFRLWAWENTKGLSWIPGEVRISPHPFERTGPDLALDGKPRFDVTRLDDGYFRRLRDRVAEAGERGMYVAVMLFNGWSVERQRQPHANPWLGHPFHRVNNVNALDGDPEGTGEGAMVHSLELPEILAVQEAYVRRVVETLNDLDHVLYEISNESNVMAREWQRHMVDFIRSVQEELPRQHPVGMTVEFPGDEAEDLYGERADWISPPGPLHPARPSDPSKVVLYDTDHLCGICGDVDFVWMSLVMGYNPVFMDPYDDAFHGVGPDMGREAGDPRWVALRRNLGFALTYASRLPLEAMHPRPGLASTGYALATDDGVDPTLLVYVPTERRVEVDLNGVDGSLGVEWLNPETGEVHRGEPIEGRGRRALRPPVRPALLLLRGSERLTPTREGAR